MVSMAGSRGGGGGGGGVLGVTGPPGPQHSYIQINVDFIQAWRIEKHENGNFIFLAQGSDFL